MKLIQMLRLLVVSVLVLVCSWSGFAQKATPSPKSAKPIIFAVLNDGKSLEPIAYVNKGKLEPPVNGSDEGSIIAGFNKLYYKAGTAYRLIFGAANSGTVAVKSSNSKADCAPNMATVVTVTNKTPLKGFVMALATNVPSKWTAASFRRKPRTAACGFRDTATQYTRTPRSSEPLQNGTGWR